MAAGSPVNAFPKRAFIRQLPHGQVELVAISYHPSKGQPWWLPDGSRQTETTWEVEASMRQRAPDASESQLPFFFRQLVVRMESTNSPASLIGWEFDGAPGVNGFFKIYHGGRKLNGWEGGLKSFPAGQPTTTLRLAVASGPFIPAPEATLFRSKNHAVAGRINDKRFVVGEVYERADKAAFSLNVDMGEFESQLRAIDLQGVGHISRIVEGQATGGLFHEVRVFDDLRAKNIREVVFESRPYHWVEFRNVALHPGQTTGSAAERADAAPLPTEPFDERSVSAAGNAADITAEQHFAGGDTNKLYFLIRKAADLQPPKDGYRLLIVMPGGDGGTNFQPFIKRICQQALPAGYLVIQLVAPVWDERQLAALVWPTDKMRYPAMKFSTEELVATVVAEVSQQHRIQARCVFTLSWSSGGPAGYAVSLHSKTKVTGSFIAMSMFKQDQLPALATAKGRAYYLFHSPQDFIPIMIPETARTLLQTNGARVELKTYPGGHGWWGDVFGNIRQGLEWLEQNAAPPAP
jgi:predicted esterase